MKQRFLLHRVPRLLALTVACAVAASCGGGTQALPPLLTATFHPDSPSPEDKSITLQPGTVTGNVFQIRVVVTGVNDFFGAAFRITFNQEKAPDGTNYSFAVFSSWDTSGSFLRDGHAVEFREDHSIPGEVLITATRLYDAARGVTQGVNVTTSSELLVLTFRAGYDYANPTAPIVDAFAFGTPREVRDSSQPPPGSPIEVTWSGGTMTAR